MTTFKGKIDPLLPRKRLNSGPILYSTTFQRLFLFLFYIKKNSYHNIIVNAMLSKIPEISPKDRCFLLWTNLCIVSSPILGQPPNTAIDSPNPGQGIPNLTQRRKRLPLRCARLSTTGADFWYLEILARFGPWRCRDSQRLLESASTIVVLCWLTAGILPCTKTSPRVLLQ